MEHENGPLVTAVIPVYNHEKYVAESIRSIIGQIYRNIELIVINDGSTDRSHDVALGLVEECRQRFARFEYINRENVGLSATMNQAMGMAKGKYMSVLASDDVALPEKFHLLVSALEEKGPEYVAAFGNAWFIDGAGQRICLDKNDQVSECSDPESRADVMGQYTRGRNINCNGEEFGTYPTLMAGNYLPAMSNVVRMTAIREAGGWTPGNMVEDVEMWLKLSKRFKFSYVDQPVALYRWHESNSMKILIGKLRFAALALLENEKEYCTDHGLGRLWQEQYSGLLTSIVRDRTMPLARRVSVIGSAESWPLFYWSMRRITKKLLIASHIHKS